MKRTALASLKIGTLLGTMLFIGCAGSIGSRPVAEFTSPAALTAIEQRPAVPPPIPKTAPVDLWQIAQAPPPDSAQLPWQPKEPWETKFAEVAASVQHRPRLTLAMRCIAAELARFHLQYQAGADASIRRFLIGGCGALVPNIQVEYFTAQAPANLSDAQVYEQMVSRMRDELVKRLSNGVDTAGFGYGRRDDRVVGYLVTGHEEAQIKPFSLVPSADGEVVIEGRLNQPAQYVEAYINQGNAGVQSCDTDLSVARPSFRFICRPAAQDETASIQMLYAPPGHVLATEFAQALVRRSSDTSPSYEVVRYADPTPVSSPEEFARVAIQQLNRVRKMAGLPEVTLAARESATATKLAPHYFAAALGVAEPRQADFIALGLLAGWDVGGMIRGASLMSSLASTLDAGRWLTSALETPVGRYTLLSPDIEQIAFGPMVLPKEGAIGAVVTGYRFHRGIDHTDDVNMLLTRVVQSRRRMGLPPPLRLGTIIAVMNEKLTAVREGRKLPRDALEEVLQRASTSFGVAMNGYIIEASSLDELEIPEEVLRQPMLYLDIGVTHHKAEGGAWAQYTILVVYAQIGKTAFYRGTQPAAQGLRIGAAQSPRAGSAPGRIHLPE